MANQVAQTGQQVRIDVSTEPLQSYYTGLTFRGYVDGVPQYIVMILKQGNMISQLL